jgi:diguanylate cyclase (GGDEF)-like protein
MKRFGRLLTLNFLQATPAKAEVGSRPSKTKSSLKTKKSASPTKTVGKGEARSRVIGSSPPSHEAKVKSSTLSVRLQKLALVLAMLICATSVVLCLNGTMSGGFFALDASPRLQASHVAEEEAGSLNQHFKIPFDSSKSIEQMLLIETPLGVDIKSITFAGSGKKVLRSDLSSQNLQHFGYLKTTAIPYLTEEMILTTKHAFGPSVNVRVVSASTYQKSRADIALVTTAVLCAQALLALFSSSVAYFGKIKVMGWFSWWLISLSALTLVVSGVLGSVFPSPLTGIFELHALGLVATFFGLGTLMLQQVFLGQRNRESLSAARWFALWLVTFGLISAAYPHPLIIGIIWGSGVLYCLFAGIRQVLSLGRSDHKPRTLANVAAWTIAAITIVSEILPWYGQFHAKAGYVYLFPTLFSAAFTAYAMSRILGAERTRRRDAQKVAESSLKHVANVVENTPVAMLSASFKGRLIHANMQAREIWPFLNWEVPAKLILDDLLGAQYAGLLAGAFHSKESVEAVINLPKGEQRPKEIICQLKIFRTATTIELTLINITDQERMTRVLENQVSTDPLTKLLNRRGLDQHLRALQTLVNKNEAQASLLFIDLDRFKIVNDLYGHDYGDELLVQIALRAKAMSEGRLTIARIGGDEFVVLVPNASLDLACDLAEELRSVISNRPYPVRDKLLTVGASIGVIWLSKGMEPKDALIHADRACGQAKKSGRGRVERIETSAKLINEFKSEAMLQELMTSRLPTERLTIYAQPLVPLSGRAGLAYEVLLRYVDESGKVVPPGQFISIAERQGLMSQLDFWVLESTLKFLDQNPRFALTSLFFTINLSGSSINDRRFLSDILKLLEKHAKVAHRITLEITETVALLDSKYTQRFMDAMIAKGVRFALDDFGAGYTSFGYLKDLPAEMLKIDGNFISTLSQDISCQRIVRTMSTLSQQLGMLSVAEWVEDEKTLELLISMQIDFAQGYFFSPAKPIEYWVQNQVAIDTIQAKAQHYTRPVPRPPSESHDMVELTALV